MFLAVNLAEIRKAKITDRKITASVIGKDSMSDKENSLQETTTAPLSEKINEKYL